MRNVILLGSNGSLGSSICRKLVDNKIKVYGTSRSPSVLIESLDKAYYKEYFHEVVTNDANNIEGLRRIFSVDVIDTLIYTLGVSCRCDLTSIPDSKICDMIYLNLTYAILATKEFLKTNIEIPKTILIVGSGAGLYAFNLLSVYSATKHGLVGFVKSLERELTKDKIMLLCPGPFESKLMPKEYANKDIDIMDVDSVANACVEMILNGNNGDIVELGTLKGSNYRVADII